MSVELGRILVRDHPDLFIRKITQYVVHHLLGIGPRAVAMGIIGFKEDVLDPDGVAGTECRQIVDWCR